MSIRFLELVKEPVLEVTHDRSKLPEPETPVATGRYSEACMGCNRHVTMTSLWA